MRQIPAEAVKRFCIRVEWLCVSVYRRACKIENDNSLDAFLSSRALPTCMKWNEREKANTVERIVCLPLSLLRLHYTHTHMRSLRCYLQSCACIITIIALYYYKLSRAISIVRALPPYCVKLCTVYELDVALCVYSAEHSNLWHPRPRVS